MTQLKGVTISGYRGVSNAQGQELKLEGLAARNVFIGPNNGGKSTVYRFILGVVQHLASSSNAVPLQHPHGPFDPNNFWQQNEQAEFWGRLTFTSPGADLGTLAQMERSLSFVRDGEWRLSVHVRPFSDRQAVWTACPQVWVEARQDWFDAVRYEGGGPPGVKSHAVNINGQYTEQQGRQESAFVNGARSLMGSVKTWAEGGRFFDAFRALHRAGRGDQRVSGQRVEDGAGVLKRLFDWQNDHNRSASFHRFTGRVLRRINRLFDRPFAEMAVRSAPGLDLSLRMEAPEAVPIPLQSMGSGIAQMVLILASLEEDREAPGKPYHYHLEEPELHLHPRLLRRFMAQFAEYAGTQFFISSHSNVVLDTIREADRVYRFYQEDAGNCRARPVEGIVHQHALLDALGVNGSSLVQANCVIWVEGPSDRLYLRRWLDDLVAEKQNGHQKKEPLVEGADYAFVFYGGAVLGHFGLDAEEGNPKDLVSMLAISRYSAVVMDRDKPPGQAAPLTKAKEAIIQAAAQDQARRLACVTVGRTIENDLPPELLLEQLAKRLSVAAGSLDGALKGETTYANEVLDHLGITDEDARKKEKRKLEDKVGLATAVLERLGKSALTPRPPYVEELYQFILRSRVE